VDNVWDYNEVMTDKGDSDHDGNDKDYELHVIPRMSKPPVCNICIDSSGGLEQLDLWVVAFLKPPPVSTNPRFHCDM